MAAFELPLRAILSECGAYRYQLWRDLGQSERQFPSTVVFIGVNPSTADATVDDATIRKMRGFAHRWGHTRLGVVNLFAYRATDVRALQAKFKANANLVASVVGPDNEVHIVDALHRADLVVPCWGNATKIPRALRPQLHRMCGLLDFHRGPMRCLGETRSGDPRHPLMLGYDTPLQAWKP